MMKESTAACKASYYHVTMPTRERGQGHYSYSTRRGWTNDEMAMFVH